MIGCTFRKFGTKGEWKGERERILKHLGMLLGGPETVAVTPP